MTQNPIGVFDSGVGGISVLRALREHLPNERFIYYGDNLNAPYGIRPEEEIRLLTFESVNRLVERNIKALVVACNTATSAAAKALRARFSFPIIGIEPALKPAALSGGEGVILVMATPATLRQDKFKLLMQEYGQRARMLPCPGLMEFAEQGEIDSPALDAYLAAHFEPYRHEKVDSIVLGCTHYVFLRGAIGRAMPGVRLYDGNDGTAHQLKNLLVQAGLQNSTGPGGVEFLTSGDPQRYLPIFNRLYKLPKNI